jgi:hypothetical protein
MLLNKWSSWLIFGRMLANFYPENLLISDTMAVFVVFLREKMAVASKMPTPVVVY